MATTRRLPLPDSLFEDEEPADELTEAQVDAMLMPRPLPMAGELPRDRAAPIEAVGLRWGIGFSLLAWAAIIIAALRI